MDVMVKTVVGGALALECDFTASNPAPEVRWFANSTMLEEDTLHNNALLFLDGGRYLYMRELNAQNRTMLYHCEVVNFHNESGMHLRSPTTYTLSTDLIDIGLTEYKGLGRKTGRVGEAVQFVYVAAIRDTAGESVVFGITCASHLLVKITIGSQYIVTATLTSKAENETEVSFTCELLGFDITETIEIMGTIIVSSEHDSPNNCCPGLILAAWNCLIFSKIRVSKQR